MLDWCAKNNVEYIIGIARNSRLESIGIAHPAFRTLPGLCI